MSLSARKKSITVYSLVKTAENMQTVCDYIESKTDVVITGLDLTSSPLTLEAAIVLGNFLARNTTLQSLNLCSTLPKVANKTDNNIFAEIASGLCLNRSIVRLNLVKNDLDLNDFRILNNFLLQNTTLQSLDLNENIFTNETIRLIESSVLNELCLSTACKSSVNGLKIAIMIAANPLLSRLDLSNHLFGEIKNGDHFQLPLALLKQTINKAKSLTSISFSNCGLGSTPNSLILGFLTTLMNHQTLESIDLSYNPLSSLLDLIARELNTKKRTAPRALNFDYCFSPTQSTIPSLISLISLTFLHTLSLSGIGLSDNKKLDLFWRTLASNKTLRNLVLSNNKLSSTTMGKLIPLFTKNHSLQELDLENNTKITFLGFEILIFALIKNMHCQVAHLNLSHCNLERNFNPKNNLAFTSLKEVKSLYKLNLEDNIIIQSPLISGLIKNNYLQHCLFSDHYNTANKQLITSLNKKLNRNAISLLNWQRVCVLMACSLSNKNNSLATSILTLIPFIIDFLREESIVHVEPISHRPK